MKKEEVPQDDANLLEGKFKVVKYALNEKGEYVKVPSVGWEPENVALEQAWDVINERVEVALAEVRAGRASSLSYHMERNMMDPALLAQHMGIGARRVRKHLRPADFERLDAHTLQRYAEVLQVTVDQLKRVPE
ncbi:MAG: hypothetical protein H6595_13375 [Flavobacteriales bacterium]|nr:hypothetical protein [Flavobacteriales bacterium]MCB9168457.1 hypothetical protein [Flavobacteriales bacterium]